MTLTFIPLSSDNRMLRIGGGKHKNKLFFRMDLWFFGLRLS